MNLLGVGVAPTAPFKGNFYGQVIIQNGINNATGQQSLIFAYPGITNSLTHSIFSGHDASVASYNKLDFYIGKTTGLAAVNVLSLRSSQPVLIGSGTGLGLDVSGSTTISGSLNVSGSITSTSTITAQTLVVQTITSSVLYSSGSNIFGNSLANTQQFTGSVGITGSLTLNNIAVPTSASLASTYLQLAGGTLTGDLSIAYTTANLRLFLNNTTATTGRSWYLNSYSNMSFRANQLGGSGGAFIFSGANVGIGTTIPGAKFEVLTSAVGLANQPNIIGNFRGDTDGRSLIRVDNTSTSAGASALQAGISFVAYSNVSSQPSANKHEAQIILGSTGANSVTGGQNGTLQIVAPQDIAFNVSASNTIMTGSNYTAFGYNAMYISRTGNVGIGQALPSFKLHVNGTLSAKKTTISGSLVVSGSTTGGYLGDWNMISYGDVLVAGVLYLSSSVALTSIIRTLLAGTPLEALPDT
jgi:hypothetical protein